MPPDPPAPLAGIREPKPPARFNWPGAYQCIEQAVGMKSRQSDPHRAAAHTSALREIDKAVMDAYHKHRPASSTLVVTKPMEAIRYLQATWDQYHHHRVGDGSAAIARSLNNIYSLTHARYEELKRRSSELLAVLVHQTPRLPNRATLGHWLRQQADAAVDSELERRYFTELAATNLSESDPWTVSRQLVERLPSPGDAEQAARLQAAHDRLVGVMARGLSRQPLSSGKEQLPCGFQWKRAYGAIEYQHQVDLKIDDIYAAAASSSALREIDQVVSMAYDTHCQVRWRLAPASVHCRVQALRIMAQNATQTQNKGRRWLVDQSIDHIYLLTHTRNMELRLRGDEFRTASLSFHARLPDREALGKWLRKQSDAARSADLERRYYTELAEANGEESDPWTVSKQLVRSLPTAANAAQAEQLQAAHNHLVRAMANALSEVPRTSRAWEPPERFNRQKAYDSMQRKRQHDTATGDSDAAAASASALREIDQAVTDALATHSVKTPFSPIACAPDKTHTLRAMRHCAARTPHQQLKLAAIDDSLEDIYKLTHARETELALRSTEMQVALFNPHAQRPDPEGLDRWLRHQADAAHDSGPERWYFTQLARELAQGRDPWTVSRALIENLPGPGTAQWAARLQAAHRHLVQTMRGGSSAQAAEHLPGAVPAVRESRAAASIRQEIAGRLSNRNPLSDAQVGAVLAAVTKAAASGTLGASTSQPEARARDLLEAILASFRRPTDELTDSEVLQELTDAHQLQELLEELDGLGHL